LGSATALGENVASSVEVPLTPMQTLPVAALAMSTVAERTRSAQELIEGHMPEPEDKPELSSTELLRQAREQFAAPKLQTSITTQVDGPSIQDLLAVPLSSESLLPKRAVDHWAPSDEAPQAPWQHDDRSVPSVDSAESAVCEQRHVVTPEQPPLRPAPEDPPPPWSHASPPPAWLDPMRDELGLPPAPPRALPAPQPQPESWNRPASRPVRPPSQTSRTTNKPWRLIIAGIFVLSVLIGAFAGEDTSPTTTFELGGCYNGATQPGPVNCSLRHGVQVFAQIQVDRSSGEVPVNECFSEAIALQQSGSIPSGTTIPDNAVVTAVDAPVGNAGNTLCYFESPANLLVGSVFAE